MVYSPSKVVACIKVNGKILREDGTAVTLPFGSEYSVLIKNLNATRIKVRVSVDGTDATEGVWLIVNPNSDLELERFIRNGNLKAGNRFKFIERTAEIEEHRGIKADDGLVRIEYRVEKRVVADEVIHHTKHVYEYDFEPWPWRPCRTFPRRPFWNPDDTFMKSEGVVRAMGMHASVTADNTGITVAGGESNQGFQWTSGFETGPSQVIVLQLRGAVGGKVAKQAVTVHMKPKCETCGRVNKAVSKFCSNCGTALAII